MDQLLNKRCVFSLSFSLADNQFKFKGLTKLETISLHENLLHALHPRMFSHLDNLKALFLTGNNCIDEDFFPYPSKATIEDELMDCGDNYLLELEESEGKVSGKLEL